MTVRSPLPTPVATLAEASAAVRGYIRDTGIGASALPPGFGEVTDASGRLIATVSYNGNVWPPRKWRPGMKPLLRVS